ncbi:MAG: hypothetical protein ACK5LC_02920 [Coprobacillaceae bacterium]
MKSILIYNERGYTEFPIIEEVKISDTISFINKDNTIYYQMGEEEVSLTTFKIEEVPTLGDVLVIDYEEKEYKKEDKDKIIIHPVAGDFQIKNT